MDTIILVVGIAVVVTLIVALIVGTRKQTDVVVLSLERYVEIKGEIGFLEKLLHKTQCDYALSEKFRERAIKSLRKSEKEREEVDHRLHTLRAMHRRLLEQLGQAQKDNVFMHVAILHVALNLSRIIYDLRSKNERLLAENERLRAEQPEEGDSSPDKVYGPGYGGR